ncbi:glycoside hydrolase family 47 protein [Rhizoctonia solani AG-1 IA]|uniref:alpha-1,2-Mannosidase n=1 Tax=Thanatephorus cucumeris (strain AG1-IA) TaxID=983506 RepID=L8WUQ0_THACA|nr:glycoside hydrolase family 47 protein [Rhizoctonia solani AG-1 IA]
MIVTLVFEFLWPLQSPNFPFWLVLNISLVHRPSQFRAPCQPFSSHRTRQAWTPCQNLVMLSASPLSYLIHCYSFLQATYKGLTYTPTLHKNPRPDAAENAQHVIEIFKSAYQSYRISAWGHDSLAPLTNGYVDDRNGWGATIVDSLSTMYIMGLEDLFSEGVQFTLDLDFSRSKTNSTVSLFESTIRYIGGILSAYELDGKSNKRLIDKAQELAEKLVYGWVGDNDIPYNELNFTTNQPIIEEPAPFPGLPAQMVDPRTNNPNGTYITWGAGSDSYFEYLIKYGRLTNNADPIWTKQWLIAVDSSITHLAQEAVDTDVKGLLYLGEWYNGTFRHLGSHLGCFHGGNWIMGGRLTDNDTIVNYGLRLTDSCWNTYERTATELGKSALVQMTWPSIKKMVSTPTTIICGRTTIFVPKYLSNFYAWRATGDIKYQKRAHAALMSIEKYCKLDGGYVGIDDVRLVKQESYINQTETFLFAEVLKYLYLTFADPQKINLDEWVVR